MKKPLIESIKISRPRFWIYLAGPYLIGYALGSNTLNNFYDLKFIYLLFFFLIPANFFLYGINDIFDTDTDKFNTKKQLKETKTTAKNKKIYKILILSSMFLSLPAFLFLNLNSILLISIFIFLAFAYSSPPFRFKSKPIIDSASNLLYVIPGFIGYCQLTNDLPPPIIIFMCFLWTFSMHLYSAVPDIKADIKANLKTTAVLLGYKNSLLICFIFWGMFSLMLIHFSNAFIISLTYPAMAFAGIYLGKSKISGLYWLFPYINFILGFILFIFVSFKFL